jgi:hypothetical protein
MNTVGRIVRLPPGTLGVLIDYDKEAKPGQKVLVRDESGHKTMIAVLGQPYSDPVGRRTLSGLRRQYEDDLKRQYEDYFAGMFGSGEKHGKKKNFLFRTAYVFEAAGAKS